MSDDLSGLHEEIERLREYADLLERAPVHDDMGLSLAHTQCADVMREAAAFLQAQREAAEAHVSALTRQQADVLAFVESHIQPHIANGDEFQRGWHAAMHNVRNKLLECADELSAALVKPPVE